MELEHRESNDIARPLSAIPVGLTSLDALGCYI